jgi:hypothetical protein
MLYADEYEDPDSPEDMGGQMLVNDGAGWEIIGDGNA